MTRHDDEHFMAIALRQARESYEHGGIPVGAALAIPGHAEPLAVGHNRRNQERNRILHGEMTCLRAVGLGAIPSDATLYTTLNPCSMCAGAILLFGIRRVVIGQERVTQPAAARFVGEAVALSRRIEVVVLHDRDCEALFAAFLASAKGLEHWLGDIGR